MIIQPPFFDKQKDKLYKKIIFNEPEFTRNPTTKISPEAKDLISQLLQKNQKNRAKISAVKEHSFFSDVNFDDILNLKVIPPFKPDNVTIN